MCVPLFPVSPGESGLTGSSVVAFPTVDLTDDNWETVLGTATYGNPYAAPVGRDDVWIVTVHGNDPFVRLSRSKRSLAELLSSRSASKVFVEAMDDVAAYNSSDAGGTLPANMRFARLSYARETIPTTKWWIWKCVLCRDLL